MDCGISDMERQYLLCTGQPEYVHLSQACATQDRVDIYTLNHVGDPALSLIITSPHMAVIKLHYCVMWMEFSGVL